MQEKKGRLVWLYVVSLITVTFMAVWVSSIRAQIEESYAMNKDILKFARPVSFHWGQAEGVFLSDNKTPVVVPFMTNSEGKRVVAIRKDGLWVAATNEAEARTVIAVAKARQQARFAENKVMPKLGGQAGNVELDDYWLEFFEESFR